MFSWPLVYPSLTLSLLSLMSLLLLMLLPPQPYRFRRAWTCLQPSAVWSLFTPYKTLCESDAGLVKALQDRREMFCITDPDLYDNPISEFHVMPCFL